jgi:hypothetical protein
MPIVSSVLLPRGREERRDAVHPSRPQHRPHSTRRMPFLLLASKSKVGKRPRASSSSSSSQKLDDDDGPREEKRRDAFVSLVLRAFSTTLTRGFLTKEEVETMMMCLIYSLLCVGETTFVWPDPERKALSLLPKNTRRKRERERENEPKKRGGRHFFYFPYDPRDVVERRRRRRLSIPRV